MFGSGAGSSAWLGSFMVSAFPGWVHPQLGVDSSAAVGDTVRIVYSFTVVYDFVNSRATRHRDENVNTYGEYTKNWRGCQRKTTAEVQKHEQ